MTSDLVSIIVPTYNRAYCLAQAVDSALAQTHTNIEILLIDDGSKDDTRGKVASLYGHEPRVKYHYQENRGVSAARNQGLRLAQGNFIALLDSDDAWKPWKLEVQLACLAFLPHAGMIWTDMEAVNAQGEVVYPRYLRLMYHAYNNFTSADLFSESYPLAQVNASLGRADGTLYAGNIFTQMLQGSLVHTSTVLLRRERFEKVKSFNEAWRTGEDFDFHFRTCKEGPVAFVDLPSIVYRIGQEDQLSRDLLPVAQNFLATITKMLESDPERKVFSRAAADQALANAHGWVGDQLFQHGDHASARRHLAQSLRHRPWQKREAMLMAICCLPAPLIRLLRKMKRAAQRSPK